MQGKIRIGMIGCGGIAHRHVRELQEIPEAEIVALNDTSEASIARLQEAFPNTQALPLFEDYQKMLDEVELDAVEIATPHTLHFSQAMDAIDRGLHVLLEKPMVCTVDHAKKLIANAREKDRIVVLAYQRHYQPRYRYIKKAIEEGQIGDITFVAALQSQQWRTAVSGTWRQTPELSGGGQLNDSGSHLIDILLWTTGLSAEEVYSYIDNCGTPVDVNSALSIKFKNGAKGTIGVMGDSVGRMWEDFTIWGKSGVLFYRNGKLTQTTADGDIFEPEDMPEASNPERNFIDAIFGRDIVWAPPVCGLRVIELTEAAWKSAELGKPVPIQSL